MFEISKGKRDKGIKTVIYGVSGIGKSTFASQMPSPVFIDTEGSTTHMDVARFPDPTSWTMLMQEIQQLTYNNQDDIKTLVIDTADWAESLCNKSVLAQYGKNGIEDFGYGKGYTYASEEYGKMLNALSDLIDEGVNVTLIAHAAIRTFTQPDDLGQYDRYNLNMSKQINPIIMEWCDMLLFANYETIIVTDSKTGKRMGTGGQRVMYTTHTPAWDAKNRFNLPDKLPFDYKEIAHLFEHKQVLREASQEPAEIASAPATPELKTNPVETLYKPKPYTAEEMEIINAINPSLKDLMVGNHVTPSEIQGAVAEKGYMPANMDIRKYDPKFVEGCLIAAWPKVFELIKQNRELSF